MGLQCQVCNLDSRTVKLVQLRAYNERGSEVDMSVCEHCKDLMLKGNHPMNAEIKPEQNVQGYTKSSEGYPPVRPQ